MAAPVLLAPIFAELAAGLSRLVPAAAASMQSSAAATTATAQATAAMAGTAARAAPAAAPALTSGQVAVQLLNQLTGQQGPSQPAPFPIQNTGATQRAAQGGPLSAVAGMATTLVPKAVYGLGKDIASIPFKPANMLADAGETVAKDLLDFGEAVTKAANPLAPLTERLAKLSGEMLEANRHLAKNNAAQALAYARLDVERERMNMATARETAGSSRALIDSQIAVEQRLRGIESLGINLKNLLMSGIMTLLKEGVDAAQPVANILAKAVEFMPVLKEIKAALEESKKAADAVAKTHRMEFDRMRTKLSAGPTGRDRPPIGLENLGGSPDER
jgi:hypothetical protein